MAEFWRFPDRPGPVQIPAKRPRSEYEDVPPPGATYIPREEPRYGERDGGLAWREADPVGSAQELNRNGMVYGPGGMSGTEVSGLPGVPVMAAPGTVGLPNAGMPNFEDPKLMVQGGRIMGMDTGMLKPVNMGVNGARPEFIPRQDNQVARPVAPGLLPPDASATLFVEGLPSDCTRREAAHIFRPFIGFKEVRLVRKDAKRPGGDQLVLCFVDFTDPRCAATAFEALQGYKFDETNQESDSLRLQYARFPGPRSAPRDDFRGVRDRDDVFRNRAIRR